jgi:hypothetical protein
VKIVCYTFCELYVALQLMLTLIGHTVISFNLTHVDISLFSIEYNYHSFYYCTLYIIHCYILGLYNNM